MEFFPLELCEKLVAMGCKSESGFVWHKNDGDNDEPSLDVPFNRAFGENYIPCFVQNDFTGCSERARENARILWGDEMFGGDFRESGPSEPTELWILKRHALIDHKGSAAEFVAKGLKGRI